MTNRREGAPSTADDSVRIDYVSPQLPLPDSVVQSRAQRSAESERRRVERVNRGIRARGVYLGTRPVWLEAGDTIHVHFYRELCRHDACGGELDPPHGPWSVEDGKVAAVEVRQDTGVVGRFRIPGQRRTILRGIQPGSTTLAVRVGDDSVVARVVVAPAIRSFFLDPSDTIITSADSLTVGLRMNDTVRALPADAPIRLSLGATNTFEPSSRAHYDSVSGRVHLVFGRAGEHLLIATLGQHIDSLRILVVPRGVRELNSWAPRTLSGIIVRADDGQVVAGARVTAAGRSVSSDSTGTFALHVMPRGTTSVIVQAAGFRTRELRVRADLRYGTRLEIPLSSSATVPR